MIVIPRSMPDRGSAERPPKDGVAWAPVIVTTVMVGSMIYAVTRKRFPWFAGFAALPLIPP